MRVQIIRLDQHDDIISARDKLAWNKAARLLLVWPDKGRILTRELDLVLLQRASREQGGELGLVTRDTQVRANAAALGIPTFSSIAEAQRARWRRPGARPKISRRNPPVADLRARRDETLPHRLAWQQSTWFRAGVFAIGLLAFFSLLVAFWPEARIELQPETREQAVTLNTSVDPNLEMVNFSGILPGREMRVTVEGELTAPATGLAEIGNRYATGTVQFTNLTDAVIEIPAGTIVQAPESEPVKFQTTRAGQVAAGTGKTIDLPVAALSPGRAGNLAAGRIQAVEGALGLRLSVMNPESLSGGSGSPAQSVSLNDVKRAKEKLAEQLAIQALEQIASNLSSGDYLLASTVQASRVIEESIDPAVGQPANEFRITTQVEYSALYLAAQDMDQLAGGVLDAGMQPGFAPKPGSLSYEVIEAPNAQNDGKLLLKLSARRTLLASLPSEQLARASVGLTPADAAERIAREAPVSGVPRIILTPGWWPRMPLFSFRIFVSPIDS